MGVRDHEIVREDDAMRLACQSPITAKREPREGDEDRSEYPRLSTRGKGERTTTATSPQANGKYEEAELDRFPALRSSAQRSETASSASMSAATVA